MRGHIVSAETEKGLLKAQSSQFFIGDLVL
jgi:hypothetical protein